MNKFGPVQLYRLLVNRSESIFGKLVTYRHVQSLSFILDELSQCEKIEDNRGVIKSRK